MMDALSTDLNSFQEKLKNKTQEEIDNIIAANTGDVKMTQDEVKFFNDISTDTGFKNDQLIPQTTVDKIFEDLTSNHPLLQAIGLQNNGVRLKIWKSDATGAAVWGKLFGDIQGQLDATFTSVDAEMILIHSVRHGYAHMLLPKSPKRLRPHLNLLLSMVMVTASQLGLIVIHQKVPLPLA
jgi:hypothetical protein